MTPTPNNSADWPAASVVIPTYNRGPFLERAIRSLLAQSYPADQFEVIVVDDGSVDGTPDVLARCQAASPALRVIRQPNRGPATARNLGVQNARGDIILFMDDDCVADPNWATELVRPYVDPKVGGVAGRIRFVAPNNNFANRGAGDPNDPGQPVDRDGRIAFFVTANASFRRAALDQVGGFDPSFPHAAQEDLDLSYRVRDAGWQLRYVDAAAVDHYHNHTVIGGLRRSYQIGQAQITLYRKHGIHYSVWRDLPASVLALARIPFGCFRNIVRGQEPVAAIASPMLHRLNGLMLALGRTEACLRRRPSRGV